MRTRFSLAVGEDEAFSFPVTPEQARAALDGFLRLAYENFLKSLDERYVRDSEGCKKTLATFRRLL